MSVSKHCFDRSAGRRWLVGLAAVLALWLTWAPPAWAHKASDAYLKLSPRAGADGVVLRIDIALRDLDAALDVDADGDGKLTWGEVKAAWPAIDAYVQRHVRLDGCAYDHPEPALERRSDGVYAVLAYASACPFPAEPRLRYTLLADIDPTHRGLASIERPGQAPVLRVLDPQRPDDQGVQGAATAASGTSQTAAARAGGADLLQFVREGIHHILTGYDHILFLMCLLLPSVARRTPSGWVPVQRIGEAFWPVVGIVTAFTLAHSITLALASLKLVSLPPGFIEPAIAVTIVLAALDNLVPIFRGRRALVTFFFGLIHGFGFASVLGELDLPVARFAWALFQFNVGLELGQVLVVLVATSLLFVARRSPRYPTLVIRGGSCLAILIGVVWFIERTAGSVLRF